MKLLQSLMIFVVLCVVNIYAADQFYLYNRTPGTVSIYYYSSREMKEVVLNSGSQQFIGFNPQRMTIRTNNGMCSYFSGIGMNGVYNFLNIIPGGSGVQLRYSGKSRQMTPVDLTPIVFIPDSVDKCSTPGSGVITGKKTRHLKYSSIRKARVSRTVPLTVQNLSKVPITVEVDLGGSESQLISLQPNGAISDTAVIGANQVVYNAKVYSAANGSCTLINNISMNPLFNRLYIDTDPVNQGRFRVAYGHVEGNGRPTAWNGTMIIPVIFEVSSNSSLTQEYKAACWDPKTGDVFESAV